MAGELQATLGVITDATVPGRTVVALPPSDLDDEADKVRLRIGGSAHSRAYDPELEQP